ncbi:MAG: ABC transporter permease subunit [Oscillospiraceae bacterium]|nr:ABC transporter permease subunit [Oscillospiraceae bacterium]
MMLKPKRRIIGNRLGYAYAWVSISLVIVVCVFIIWNVLYLGVDVISLNFLIRSPNASALDASSGGIFSPMAGTVILTAIGIAITLPLSLSTAIYLCFYSKKGVFKTLIETAIDILSGIPTVVIGLFSLSVFTQPWLSFLSARIETGAAVKAYGRSFLVAGIAMAIMILPFVTKSMLEALKTVPAGHIEGSYALGATKWRTTIKIALNSARDGIITGVILGMGRIIGDTAIVWLALGGTLRMTGVQPWWQPANWMSTLRSTGSTLTSYIYYTSPAGEGNSFDVSFGASFVLIVIIILLNAAVSIIGNIGNIGKQKDR